MSSTANNSNKKNNNKSSKIKGGGRAILSQESQQALIDLLLALSLSSKENSMTSSNSGSSGDVVINQDGCATTTTTITTSDTKDDLCQSLEKLSNMSKHDKKKLEKKFLKQLVKRHELEQLHRQFNNAGGTSGSSAAVVTASNMTNNNGDVNNNARSGGVSSNNAAMNTTTTSTIQKATNSNASASINPNVRIELAEAIFQDNNKKDKKDKKGKKDNDKEKDDKQKKKAKSKSSSSSQPESLFKMGSKKVIVVPRTTAIPELLKQASSKLKMKKKPLRAFVQPSSSLGVLFDLHVDLGGVEDGTVVYVTCTPPPTVGDGSTGEGGDNDGGGRKEEGKTKKKEKNDGSDDDDDDDENDNEGKEGSEVVQDPLDAVKRAYRQQQQYIELEPSACHSDDGTINYRQHHHHHHQQQREQAQKQQQQRGQMRRIDPIINHKLRQSHEESRSKLPVASHKQQIVNIIQENPVVVLSSATGSGKSTQVPQFLLDHREDQQQEQEQEQPQNQPTNNNQHNHNMKTNSKHNHNKRPYIIVTQPRKVAAISLANRVAAERGSPPPGSRGSTVGYMVRLDRRVDLRSCRIIYMTIGILLRMLLVPSSPSLPSISSDGDCVNVDDSIVPSLTLDSISALIIDEVHERDVNTDFTLTLLKGMMTSKSTQYMPRLILMSASACTELFVDYFRIPRGAPPATLEIPGKTYPVTTNWLSQCEKYCGKTMTSPPDYDTKANSPNDNNGVKLSPRAMDKIDNKFIRSLIVKIVQSQQADGSLQMTLDGKYRAIGAILVFLPGLAEIESLARCLSEEGSNLGDKKFCTILKLHSSTQKSDQERVFQPASKGSVKIVLATNIAETSLTIPDVSHVIDTCRVKESRYNPSTRIKELVTVWTSEASLIQRAGRAGRTAAGSCWRLCSEEFAGQLLSQTAPEMVRTPLDELILQICLLYEQRRDDFYKAHDANATNDSDGGGNTRPQFAIGVKPMKFLSQTPTPPSESSLVQACHHLLEVDALRVVDYGDSTDDEMGWLYRLTPLGYHLSRLPMDAKVGKILIIGCILGCLDGALTIAAALSCQKSCFLPSTGFRPLDQSVIDARNALVENGFGGRDWPGGTVKGDLIAVIAVYRAWQNQRHNQKRKFCSNHGLDNNVLQEIYRLRNQFLDLIVDAGLASKAVSSRQGSDVEVDDCNLASEDALITSACLVAGLYPNIATLVRPRKGGPKGGKLLTNNGDECRPSSSSFQQKRVREASESGKDAYAVYHAKHRTLGTTASGTIQRRAPAIFLSEVNFVSKFALLLFGGELELIKNAIIVDGWLKFKISDDGEKSKVKDNAVLILSLRKILDECMNEHVIETCSPPEVKAKMVQRHQKIIEVVRKILADAA